MQAKIELKKKAAGIWIPLPCIDQMGSCSYGDICQLLEQVTQCPPQLTAISIDCKCPIKAVSLDGVPTVTDHRKHDVYSIINFIYFDSRKIMISFG